MITVTVFLSLFFSACMTAIIMATIVSRMADRMARLERRQRLLALWLKKQEQSTDW